MNQLTKALAPVPSWLDMHGRCFVCGLSRQVYIGDSSDYGPVPGPIFGCHCDEVRLAERRNRARKALAQAAKELGDQDD